MTCIHRANEKVFRAGEVREVEISTGVKMKFCWIPPGEAQLGSPKSERSAVMKLHGDDIEPDWLAVESEESRGKYKCRGFWLGKYPVTQAEWQAVMRYNPSSFTKIEGVDSNRLPVEMVSYNDCGKFLEKLNDDATMQKVFESKGKFALLDENEWEYACRGGKASASLGLDANAQIACTWSIGLSAAKSFQRCFMCSGLAKSDFVVDWGTSF
jgi:formylglycine-generating enzyme required for sulfatase activity